MHPWTPDDQAAATAFLASLDDPTQRAFLDLLITHPDERFDTAKVADRLGLVDHQAVARATFAMGRALADVDLMRPWTEAQMGYAISADIATLFRSVLSSKKA